MKILMVLDHNYPTDQRVEKEIKTLINNNHEVVLACYSHQRKEKLYEKEGRLTIYRKPISNFRLKTSVAALKFPFYFEFWKKFISDIITNEQIDAIHIHDLPLAEVGAFFKEKCSIPLVVDLHENWPASLEIAKHTNTPMGKLLSSNKQWRRYEQAILKKADAIITVVEEMRDRIHALGIPKEKIHVISNTVDFSEFPKISTSGPKEKNRFTLFYAGGINIHRGLQIVIKALPEILKELPNVEFLILGNGSYKKELKDLVHQLEIDEHVHFLGHKNFEEMIKILSRSDIALIPHLRSEQTDCSSPNKLYQYIYTGKPILTSNCISLERLVNETRSGLSYQHDSPESFKNALIDLMNNQKQKVDLNFANEKLKEKYNWKVDAGRLCKLYNNL